MTTTLLPGLLKTVRPQRRPRRHRDLALFETGTVTLPHAGGAAPIYGVDRRPTEGELDDLDKALPAQPLHLAVAVSRRARARRLVGPGPPGRLGGRGRRGPRRRRRAGRRGHRPRRQPGAVAPGPLRRAPASARP